VKINARAMLRGESTSPHEFRIVTKSADIRWIMETVTSISYGGKPAHSVIESANTSPFNGADARQAGSFRY